MVMKICGSSSPFSSWLITFFIAAALAAGSPPSRASLISLALAARSLATSRLQLRSTSAAMAPTARRRAALRGLAAGPDGASE
jgi:hypothetical protein